MPGFNRSLPGSVGYTTSQSRPNIPFHRQFVFHLPKGMSYATAASNYPYVVAALRQLIESTKVIINYLPGIGDGDDLAWADGRIVAASEAIKVLRLVCPDVVRPALDSESGAWCRAIHRIAATLVEHLPMAPRLKQCPESIVRLESGIQPIRVELQGLLDELPGEELPLKEYAAYFQRLGTERVIIKRMGRRAMIETDPDEARDRKLAVNAWRGGDYRTYHECARELGNRANGKPFTRQFVKHAVDAARK